MKYKAMETNYTPGSMGFSEGFLMGGLRATGDWMEVDRKKANRIVRQLLKEGRKIESAEMGLDGDWGENSEVIYEGGKWVKEKFRMYNGSPWATPLLMVFHKDAPSEVYECYKKEK